jgi:ATP-dependent DNA helicase RecG
LEKNGILTVLDLLLHFPNLYIDFSAASSTIEPDTENLYLVRVIDCGLSQRFRYRRRFSLLRVSAEIGDRPVSLLFFNKHYLEDFFKTNTTAYIYGRFQLKNNAWEANTPIVFTESNRIAVVPVYNRISTIKSGKLRKLMETALAALDDDSEPLPTACLEKHTFPGMLEALKGIHFPSRYAPDDIAALKKRFVYSEFLFFQLELQYMRNCFRRQPRTNRFAITAKTKQAIARGLDFQLTVDQKKACREIAADLEGEYTMQRLLQGDVGSGKTIVAFIALLMAMENGCQGAFLAPTEILAHQHYVNAREFFKDAAIEVLTGSTSAKERKEILQRLVRGEIDILFGTHALLTETVHFKHLAVVVIDEQHRFGVSQRAALYYKGDAVDLLVTTATPIPRTMLLSLYNDLSVSVIKTKPSGRLPIITKIIAPERREKFYPWLREKVADGEKVYIILPLIEKSDFFSELRDIETESAYFKEVFEGIPTGIVTGKTPAAEKDSILSALAAGSIRVLVATTVIEVGIDVKDATVIVIENADRYGLSQLHQLRGRVGRGARQSYCYLLPSPKITDSGKKRLTTIAGTDDGFKIAETDLEMRGGGIISGQEQSGRLDFKVGDLKDDYPVYEEARADAALLLSDQSLQNDYIIQHIDQIKQKLKDINFS